MADGIHLEDKKIGEASTSDNYHVSDMISQAKLRADARIGVTTWQENSIDITRVLSHIIP